MKWLAWSSFYCFMIVLAVYFDSICFLVEATVAVCLSVVLVVFFFSISKLYNSRVTNYSDIYT